jgi:hypothetical protein
MEARSCGSKEKFVVGSSAISFPSMVRILYGTMLHSVEENVQLYWFVMCF